MTSAFLSEIRNSVSDIFKNRNRIIVMGVLNVTPDSFSDGGAFFDTDKAVQRFFEMVHEGADIIDIGGESSRPGSEPVSAEEELRRLLPVLEKVVPKCSVPISIDTHKAEVAEAVLTAGASIINDITALSADDRLASVVARQDAGLILMHMRGTPATMQSNTEYDHLIREIKDSLSKAVNHAEKAGVNPELIMIDPGIGFGKDVQGNLDILKSLDEFTELGKPVMVGASRKSFIGKLAGAPVDDRESGSLAAAVTAVLNGASAVRVHNVAATRQAVDIALKLRGD
jgi:dihydropteroate synthase